MNRVVKRWVKKNLRQRNRPKIDGKKAAEMVKALYSPRDETPPNPPSKRGG